MKEYQLKDLKLDQKIQYEIQTDYGNFYRKGIISKIKKNIIFVKLKNNKIDKITVGDIIKVIGENNIKNYSKNDKIEEFEINLGGFVCRVSIHVQKRLIERSIYTKEELKSQLNKFSSRFKEVKISKRKQITQLLKYNVKAKFYIFKDQDIVLVLNPRSKVVMTAYKLSSSKLA